MSDKSHGAEPEREDIVAGEPDAAEPTEAELSEDDSLSIFDIEDPDALAAAEEAVIEDDEAAASDPATDGELDASADADAEADDAAIAELEENFTPEEQAAAAAPIVRKTAKAPVRKKDAPTRRRGEAAAEHEDPYKAKTPGQFVKQSAGELKKVVWPTWPQTVTMFSAVLVFVLIMIGIVGVLDYAFGWGLLQLFGSN